MTKFGVREETPGFHMVKGGGDDARTGVNFSFHCADRRRFRVRDRSRNGCHDCKDPLYHFPDQLCHVVTLPLEEYLRSPMLRWFSLTMRGLRLSHQNYPGSMAL